MNLKFLRIAALFFTAILSMPGLFAQYDFSTDYFKIHINNRGWITSMKNITVRPNPEFSPADKPSPLLSLYDSKKGIYYQPTKAKYNEDSKALVLQYPNGSVAEISIALQKKYFKLTLHSLSPRNGN